MHKTFLRNKTYFRILQYSRRGGIKFFSQKGTVTQEIACFGQTDDLFFSVGSGFIHFYSTFIDTEQAQRPGTFIKQGLSFFMEHTIFISGQLTQMLLGYFIKQREFPALAKLT